MSDDQFFISRAGRMDATKERIKGFLREHVLSTTGWVGFVFDTVREKHGGNFSEANVLAAAKELGIPQDTETWDEVFAGFEDRNMPENWAVLLTQSRQFRRAINVENLRATLHDIVRDDPSSLAVHPEVAARRQAAKLRQARIERIADGHATYPLWASAYGGFKWLACSSLENESDEMLEALAQKVPQWRAQLAGGRVGKQTITESDSLGELTSKPERVASAVSARPLTNAELVTPDGTVINSKKDLIRFVNAHRDNTKRLIQKNGRTVPELARRFEEILNS